MADARAAPRSLASGSVRARVVIVRDDALALIERRRDGARYYTFPGGGVAPGETPEVAAEREAYEELGLRVVIGVPVAVVSIGETRQHFFLATPLGGTFGAGRGAEMVGGLLPERGTYRAVWLPLAALAATMIHPVAIAELVAARVVQGWPATPLMLQEPAP